MLDHTEKKIMEKFIKYVKILRKRGPRNISVRLKGEDLSILCFIKKEPIEEFIYCKSPRGCEILEMMYHEALEFARVEFENEIYSLLNFRLELQDSKLDLSNDKLTLQYKCRDCK